MDSYVIQDYDFIEHAYLFWQKQSFLLPPGDVPYILVLSVMTSDRRFEEAAIASQGGEVKNMSEFLDRLEAKKEAEVNERVATDMLTDGEPIKKIEKYSKLSEGEIRALAAKIGVAVNEG